jgi:hypothetical protein
MANVPHPGNYAAAGADSIFPWADMKTAPHSTALAAGDAAKGAYTVETGYRGTDTATAKKGDHYGDKNDISNMNALLSKPQEDNIGFNFLRDLPPDYHQRLAGGLPLGIDLRSQQAIRRRTENMVARADDFNLMLEANWGQMIGDLEIRKLYDPMAGELENQLIRWRKSAEQMRANYLESGKELQSVQLQMVEANRREKILGQYHQRLMDSMRALHPGSHLPIVPMPGTGGDVVDMLAKYIAVQKTTFQANNANAGQADPNYYNPLLGPSVPPKS